MVWCFHLFKDFLHFIVIHRVNNFDVVSETNRCFSGILLFFYYPVDVGNLIFGYSAFSKSRLNIWKCSIHELLKPGLENLEHYFASVCEMSVTVW